MGVEIREVIVRAVIEDDPAAEAEPGAGSDEGDAGANVNMEEIVRAAVEQVLRILERKKIR